MKSRTKFEATNEQITAAFKAAGIADIKEITELSDGWFNRIYSAVDTASGRKYVIKLAPPKDVPVLTYEQNMIDAEVKCYRMLAEKTGVKAPKIIYSDFSETVIPTAYFIMEFLDGVRLDNVKLSPEDKVKVNDKMAWILSEFHKIEGVGYGYEHNGLKTNYKDAITSMTQALIDDCARFHKKCKIGEKLLGYINKFSAELVDVPCVLVHYDLHAMNVFYSKDDNGEVELSVLDLERYFYGDPLGDFAIVENSTSLANKNITKSYNKYAQCPIQGNRAEEIRLNIMVAYLAVIMYSERFSRFDSIAKYFNIMYYAGTAGYKYFGRLAFSKLKKLSK